MNNKSTRQPFTIAYLLGSVQDLSNCHKAVHEDQLSIQGIQYHGTSCLELSVFSYEKYHQHFQGTSEN